jgi:hypothetical protein
VKKPKGREEEENLERKARWWKGAFIEGVATTF